MLTQNQIDHLFEFCEKHFVRHYDLQVELVDHLANAIEEQIKNQPNLSFQKALENVYQSFGPAGFGPLITEKRVAAEKQGRNMFSKFFKEHLRWPKVILLFLIVAVAYSLFKFHSGFFRIFYISLLAGSFLTELYAVFNFTRTISSTGKKFLIADFSRGSGMLFVLLFIPFCSDIFDKSFPPVLHSTWHVLFSSTMLATLVTIIIADIQVLSSVEKKIRKDYPRAFAN
jgi:hypothetical protein